MQKAMTKWLPKWRQNDYHTYYGKPVTNRDDFILLDELTDDMEVGRSVSRHF